MIVRYIKCSTLNMMIINLDLNFGILLTKTPVLSSTTTIEHMNKLWTTQHKITHNWRVNHKIYVRIMNIQEEVRNMSIEIILMKAALHIWTEVNQSSFSLFQLWYSEYVLESKQWWGITKSSNIYFGVVCHSKNSAIRSIVIWTTLS